MKSALDYLRAFARQQTHPGYTWAAVMDDGDLMCVRCVRANYRQIFAATKARAQDGWEFVALTSNADDEEAADCCHCHKQLWEDYDASVETE